MYGVHGSGAVTGGGYAAGNPIVVMKALPAKVRARETTPSTRPVSAGAVFRAAARAIAPGRQLSSRG